MALGNLLCGRLDKVRRPQSYRPRLEALETRELLSVCTVDRLTDGNPNGGGDGGNGMGDLRYCVVESLYRVDTINLGVMGTINLRAGLQNLTRNVSINGLGANLVAVRGGTGYYPIFRVAAGAAAVISGLTMSNGLFNSGGGVYNSGTLTINNSTISGNSSDTGYGGGIYNDSGSVLVINNSTISGNSARNYGSGGGIYNVGMLTVSNSTISGNSANGSGGGILNEGTLTVSNSTISGNSAMYSGGGIYPGPHMMARNTIIARNNAPSGLDVYGNMGSQGYNLLGDPLDASGWISTDVVHENPLLGPMQNNGGPTLTMALLPGSPALDAGDPTQANTPDQRGVQRTGGVNIGAYQASATTLLVAGFPSPINPGTRGSFTVTARDPYGNTASGYRGTVHFTSSDAQAGLPANYTFTAADNGLHTFSAILNTLGTQSITATDTATASLTGTQTGILVTNAPSTMQVAGFPSPIMAGETGRITVTLKERNGNVAIGYRGTVHFTSSDGQAALPGDYTFTATDSGVHTFSVNLKTAGTQSVIVTDTSTPSLTGTQAGIQVTAGAVRALQVSGFPSPTIAGVPGNLTVTARDSYGNIASGYRGTVHFTSSDFQASLPADYTFTVADFGTHTFSVTLKTAGSQSLTATDTAMGSLTGMQASIQINPAAASAVSVTGFPSPATAGVPGNLTVTARDTYGNVSPGYRGTIHFTSSDSRASLPADYTFTAADNGVHTLNATLKTAGTQSLTATDTITPTLTGTQSGIIVNPAAAATLSVSFIPSPITAGVNGSLTATVQDAYGNIASGYRGIVHFSSSDGQAVLPSNYTFTADDNGTHTVNVILKTAGNQTITVADTSNPALTASATVLVTPAAVAMLRVAGFPSPVAAGNPQLLTVTVQDPYGNTAIAYRGTIHFTSSDPQALLAYDYTFTAADNGAHPFAAVFGTVGTQTLTATDTANAAITGTQSGIVVIPGTPDHFQIVTSVSSTVAGTPFDIIVTVQDRFHNTVTGYTGTVAFSSADPYGATLPPNYTFQPSDQGMATFAAGATLYTAGTWDVTATDTSSGITGSAFVKVVAAPAVAFQVIAPASVASGMPFDVTVLAVDPYGNTDTNYQGTITFTTSDSNPGVVLPPDYTFQAADAGMATFPGGVTLITPGDQTLTITDTSSGITGGATVTVTAGDAGNSPSRGAESESVATAAWPDRTALDDWFASRPGERYEFGGQEPLFCSK